MDAVQIFSHFNFILVVQVISFQEKGDCNLFVQKCYLAEILYCVNKTAALTLKTCRPTPPIKVFITLSNKKIIILWAMQQHEHHLQINY